MFLLRILGTYAPTVFSIRGHFVSAIAKTENNGTHDQIGLELLLFLNQTGEFLSSSVQAGVRFGLHSADEDVFLENQGFTAPVGRALSVAYSYVRTYVRTS